MSRVRDKGNYSTELMWVHSYLRATKWKTDQAIQRLEATLRWRRAFGIYDIVNAKHVEPEVRSLFLPHSIRVSYPAS